MPRVECCRCVIRGCVPKKLLVYGSSFADEFTDAEGFGWQPTSPKFDWNFLVENKARSTAQYYLSTAHVSKGALPMVLSTEWSRYGCFCMCRQRK